MVPRNIVSSKKRKAGKRNFVNNKQGLQRLLIGILCIEEEDKHTPRGYRRENIELMLELLLNKDDEYTNPHNIIYMTVISSHFSIITQNISDFNFLEITD